MKIAVAGKGGSGKTTIAGTLARLMARRGVDGMVAIDGDSNPNLALTLGFPADSISSLKPMPRSVLRRFTDEEGQKRVGLADPPDVVLRHYGIGAPDGITLLLMGTIDHAGGG